LTDIPAEVRRLVYRCTPSVRHLELLLLMRQVAPLSLTAADLSARVGMRADVLERPLFDLLACGLLAATRPLPIAYRYHPNSPEHTAMVERLAELYAGDRLRVIGLIEDREHESLRLFSDAFKLREDG
jgi:hypothetical protein